MAFGDIRVAERADWLIERIAAFGSVVLRRIGETRAGEIAVHRFLSSSRVSAETVVSALSARTAEQCRDRQVLVIQDTSEINFSGRDKKRRGLGPAGDGKTPGFFIHPVIAVDIADEAVIGLVDAQIWTRSAGKRQRRDGRSFEEKESVRWLAGHRAAAERLADAASIVMVCDREADIYELFAYRPPEADLIVRAAQDRCLVGDGKLFAAVAKAKLLGTRPVHIVPRGPGEKKRVARVELRSVAVAIARPTNRSPVDMPADVALTCVEAREVDPPAGKAPILWRLLTTMPVESAEDAERIIDLYRLRWKIEQLFRVLKSDGLRLEETQVIDAQRLFNLTAVSLAAAVRILQLVDARDGSGRPLGDVLDETFLQALQRISRKLEGATAKQKNPHPPQSLSFLAWIAARLGGWNCYYGKPGPKTIGNGWNELAVMLAGYLLAKQEEIP